MQNRSGRDDWNRPRLGGHHDNNDDDDEYAVPEEDYDDGMVHIQPAKHCPTNSEYADRPHRPMPSVPGVSETLPRPPKRVIPGPTVNRDLKPGRQVKTKTEVLSKPSVPASPQNQRCPPRPTKPIPVIPVIPVHDSTVGSRLPFQGHGGLPAEPPTSHITPPWREQQKTNFKVSAAPSGAKCKPPLSSSQRLSLDLESQELFDSRQMHRKEWMPEMNSVKRQHHEWPQDKGDSNFQPQKRPAEMSDWYVGAFSRVEAEHALHLVNREGAFLVRDCSKSTAQEPLVLAVFFEKRVFNIQIRYSECTSKYTLGTGLRTNDAFDTVDDIIKFHSIFPIALIDGRNPNEEKQKRACVLMYPVTRIDMLQLLNMNT